MTTSQILCNLDTFQLTYLPTLGQLSAKISANMLTNTHLTDIDWHNLSTDSWLTCWLIFNWHVDRVSADNLLTNTRPMGAQNNYKISHLSTPLIPNINIKILKTDLYTFPWRITCSWENLIKDQIVIHLVIILLILTPFSLHNAWILWGENWCWSLLGDLEGYNGFFLLSPRWPFWIGSTVFKNTLEV